PSGISQTLTDLQTNELLVINESSINANSEDKNVVSFTLSPNPASTIIDINAQFSNVADTILLELISSNGVVVYKKTFDHIGENWNESILLTDLKLLSGTYYVKASSRTWSISKYIVIIP
ncbi:MAG TPA: T9SS type A sorting domain-containing protein, partial [Saprospiraceae bacterium]|nr:T9SS type A sorting domain-containing protein [Saprospiraceae bacterium]